MSHNHPVLDTDNLFTIDPVTRVIKSQSSKTSVVQYDHNSERFSFELPRFIEGHDMTTCNKVEVHYLNAGQGKDEKQSGVYEVDDLQEVEGENKVTCSWLISAGATQYAGKLAFLLRFCCLEEETVTYAWNTAPFERIHVTEGMNASATVVLDYSDILEKWKAELFAAGYINAETMQRDIKSLQADMAVEKDRVDKLSNYVTPQMFGAKADGVTDDTAAIQAAVATGRSVFFPDGEYVFSRVEVKAEAHLYGNADKSVLISTGAGFALTNGRVKKTFKSLRFDCNNGSGITVEAVADTAAANTLAVESCYFVATAYSGNYAVNLFGENEANFVNCTFYGCNGIFIDSSINPNVSGCVFRHSSVGILYAYTGMVMADAAYTCGLRVSDCTFLGCELGLKAVEADSLQVNNCMIDYCDHPVVLVGQSGALLANTFISSRNDHPGLYAGPNNGGTDVYGGNGLSTSKTEKLTVTNCSILTHVVDYTESKVSAVVLRECVHSVLSYNHITWFTEDGVQLNDCVNSSLTGLHIACDSRMVDRSSVYAINSYKNGAQEDDSSNHYSDINTELPIFYHYAVIRGVNNGYGFFDEVRGSVVVAAGSTKHSLKYTVPVVGAVATLSNPSYNVAVNFADGSGDVNFIFDRTLEQNVRINYIVFCTR